jgi:NTE family protein
MIFDLITRIMSPYQFNPLNVNPLRNVLEQTVDFERLQTDCVVRLFLCATNVRTGKVKIFENHEVCVDAVLASGCLPFMFHAVEIDGEAYWDGGYMGNPAIYPLIYKSMSRDVIVVHINPLRRDEVPRTATEIMNRINEISFNSSLMREMRAIEFVTRLIETGQIKDGSLNRMMIHAIDAEEFMCELSASSKLNPDWEFLTHLRDVGRKSAENWITAHFDDLNRRSTIDVRGRYL